MIVVQQSNLGRKEDAKAKSLRKERTEVIIYSALELRSMWTRTNDDDDVHIRTLNLLSQSGTTDPVE